MSIDRYQSVHHYIESFNKARDRFDLVLEQSEAKIKLEYDKDGLIGYDLNGNRLKASKSVERKLKSKIATQETESFFTDLDNNDFENMSAQDFSSFVSGFRTRTRTEFEKSLDYKNQFEKLRTSKRNIFELDTSNPAAFAEGLLGVLNPEEAADFMLMLIFQMWARVTNSPKIPGFDVYTDFISAIGAFEANPITANNVYMVDANRLNKDLGNTPWRSNHLQGALGKYNDAIYEERGCTAIWDETQKRLIFTEKDYFLDVKVPILNSVDLLPEKVKKGFQIREYSRAEIAYKSRLIKLIELAYEKGMVHALTNHISGGASVLEVFSDVLGVPNFFAGRPAHK
jgi:hypothetical protein